MMNRSLVGKLWLAIIVLVILVMFVLGIFLSQFFEDFYFSLRARELQDNGIKIAEMISSSPDSVQWEKELYTISKYIDAKITVTDRLGLIMSCNITGRGMHRGMKLQFPDVEQILEGSVVVHHGAYPGVDTTVLSVGVPIKYDNQVIGAVLLISPVEPVTQNVRTVQKFIFFGAIGTILLATVLGFILSKKITKPILDMNRVALEMAKGNFKERVETESQDELGLLGNSLNFLSAELEKNLDDLSTEKEQLENILTSMTDAVITFDTDGQVLLVNRPAGELLKKAGITGVFNIDDFSNVPELYGLLNSAIKEKTGVRGEIQVGDRTFKIGVTPLRPENGDIKGAVAVLHDFTRDKRLENLRREFVANVSHELRSPLSLLQGYVEALADGIAENEEEKQRYLNIVLEETLRLRRLVNDLLDLTQLETGNMSLRFEELSPGDLVKRVAERLKPMFEEKKISFEIELADNVPHIMGDEDKLQQVLVNLLDNSIKYTPEGGRVTLGVSADGNYVTVFVEDTGSGIPQEEIDQIWERFYKVDKARTRESAGGTGLGLAIVKNIIQAHGGNVSVQSEKGKGTIFSFNLEIKAQ